MLRSMYSSVSGLKAQQTKMDVIGNNIANVSTVGFKQGDVYFKEMLVQDLGRPGNGSPFNKEVGLGVTVSAIDTKFTQGALQSTGVTLDFAIQGDGMFVIAPSNYFGGGAPGNVDFADADATRDLVYTRDGVFRFDHEGYLRTGDGGYVLSAAGDPITYNDTLGNPNGAVAVEAVIGVASFFNYAGLEKVGDSNFKQSEISGTPMFGLPGEEMVDAGTGSTFINGSVKSGFLEMSNVDLALEFTNMIVVSRAYQANSKIITTSDEMLQELVNMKR